MRGAWGDLAKQCTIMSFESLPWAARIKEFGLGAEVLGTKGSLLGAVQPGTMSPGSDPTAMLQSVLGPLPVLTTQGNTIDFEQKTTNSNDH